MNSGCSLPSPFLFFFLFLFLITSHCPPFVFLFFLLSFLGNRTSKTQLEDMGQAGSGAEVLVHCGFEIWALLATSLMKINWRNWHILCSLNVCLCLSGRLMGDGCWAPWAPFLGYATAYHFGMSQMLKNCYRCGHLSDYFAYFCRTCSGFAAAFWSVANSLHNLL